MQNIVLLFLSSFIIVIDSYGKNSLDDISKIVQIFREVGASDQEIREFSENLHRIQDKYCDSRLVDEGKLRGYQKCQLETMSNTGHMKEMMQMIQRCYDDSFRGVSAIQIRDMACNKQKRQEFDQLFREMESCIKRSAEKLPKKDGEQTIKPGPQDKTKALEFMRSLLISLQKCYERELQ